jgi:hypothetical protein
MIVDAQKVRRAVLLLRGKAEDARATEQRAMARSPSPGARAPPSARLRRVRRHRPQPPDVPEDPRVKALLP